MSISADEPRVRIIPIVDDERDTPGELRPGDQTVELVATRPWLSIGERFVDGIPFPPTPQVTSSDVVYG
jgi:hypothetical protein